MAQFKFKISYKKYSYIYKVNACNKLDAWAKANEHIKSKFGNGDLQYEVDCFNINNNTYNTMEKGNIRQIINFDYEGWPEYKRSIKDLIIAFGGVLNEQTGMWEIPNSEYLYTCPRLYIDDGMGYGTDEEYIIDVNCDKIAQTCNIWRDHELPYAQVYAIIGAHPGHIFKDKDTDTEYVIEDIVKNVDNNEIMIQCSKWDFAKIEEFQKQGKKYCPIHELFKPEYVAECIRKELNINNSDK